MTTRAASFVPALLLAFSLTATGSRAASVPLEPILSVTPDVPQAALDAGFAGKVVLQLRVAPAGYVDSVRVTSGDARLRAAALAAARWHIYAPQSSPVWTSLTIAIDGATESEPLNPDVVALAQEAEAAGDWRNALDAWTGALARLGTHPSLLNEWAIREHAVRAARHVKPYPPAPGDTQTGARGARIHQARVVARVQHEDLVGIFDNTVRVAPWWGEPYLWRAASLTGCGRSREAVRSLRFYLMCNPDSAGTAVANLAMTSISAGDSLIACEMLKKHAQVFSPEKSR